jgi:hypothetical protein
MVGCRTCERCSCEWGFIATATIQEKTARLEAARKKVEAFAAAGGDLKSADAVPLGIEFMDACADLAEDFGYEIIEREISAVKNLIPIDFKTK